MLLRKGKKFAIIQVISDRLDIGTKLKGAKTTDQFEAAGNWNTMVIHRVRISDPKETDSEVLAWIRKAYDGVLSERVRVQAN
jgi:hypothetical protein